MNIIFLDIDGVLNCETGYKTGQCKYGDGHGCSFYPPSKDLLNKLIDETDSKIVISSTWRMSGIDAMVNMWKARNMSGEIIGITPVFRHIEIPDYTIPRGCEIDFYLENILNFGECFWSEEKQLEIMNNPGVSNYIIIDDDSDMLYNQRKHFVHVLPSPRNKEGFNEKHYKKAKQILSKSFADIHFKK